MLNILLLLALLGIYPPSNTRQTPSLVSEGSRDTHGGVVRTRVHPDLIALRKQMADHPELPPIEFWTKAVARCETGHGINGANHWRRGEHWKVTTVTGSMGIATVTWRGYGGYAYAERAAKASPWAQIIVANRIGFLGYQTKNLYRTLDDRLNNRPLFRPAAGFDQGWGGVCARNWLKKNGYKKG